MIDYLEVEITLPEVVPLKGLTLDTAAEAHLGHAIMGEHPTAPDLLQGLRDRPWDVIRAQQDAFYDAFPDCGPRTRSGHGENLRGNTDETMGLIRGDRASGVEGVRDRAVRKGMDIHPSKAPNEGVPHAVRSLTGKENRYSLPRSYKGRHAVVEEVHGELQIPLSEKESLCLPCAPRRAESDDSGYVVVTNRQKSGGVAGKVRRGGKGNSGDIGKSGQGRIREGGQMATVERGVAAGVVDGLVHSPELVGLECFHKGPTRRSGADVGLSCDPCLQGSHADHYSPDPFRRR